MSFAVDAKLHVSRGASSQFRDALSHVFPSLSADDLNVETHVPMPNIARVPVYCANNIAQDALASKLASPMVTKVTREELTTPDGGTIAVDHAHIHGIDPATLPADCPVLVILPGLTGDSSSHYLQKLLAHITFSTSPSDALRVVVFIYRGCGGLKFTSGRTYCAADTSDVELSMDLLKSRYPNAVFGAIGFSMGSMMLTRTIHRRGAGYVSCAVSVSNPFDLLKASHNLLRFPYRHIHTRVLAGGLRKLIQDNQEIFRGVDKIDFEAALSCKSVREFDEFVTRRLFGYESVDQYYIDASPCRFVHEIQTPLLCINATDDPVAPPDGLPRDTIRTAAGDIALLETNRGSHISFLHCESKLGTGLQSIGLAHRWATTFVLKYLLPNTKNTSVETKTSVDEPQHQQVSEADVSKA